MLGTYLRTAGRAFLSALALASWLTYGQEAGERLPARPPSGSGPGTRAPDPACRPGIVTALHPAVSRDSLACLIPLLPFERQEPLGHLRLLTEPTGGAEGGELEGFGPYSTGAGLALNSFGQRSQSNIFLLDGADHTEPWLRGPLIPPSPGPTEFVSLAAGFVPAGVGSAAGAAHLAHTRAGTGQWQRMLRYRSGSAALNARNFFDADRPAGLSHEYGFNMAGPVRGSWRLFGAVESLRERQGLTVLTTVPTAAQKLGEFGGRLIYDPLTIQEVRPTEFQRQPFPGNRIPQARIPEPSRRLAALYADPLLPGDFHNFRSNPLRRRSYERLDGRLDGSTSRLHHTVRGNWFRHTVNSPSVLPDASASDFLQHANAARRRSTAWSVMYSMGWSRSPKISHNLRAAYNYSRLRSTALDSGLDSAAALGIAGLGTNGIPTFRLTGYLQLGAAPPVPFRIRTSTRQLEYAVDGNGAGHRWSLGVHLLRHEAQGDAVEWPERGTFLFTPDYTSQPGVAGTGDAFASLLTGYPAEVRRDVLFEPYRVRGWEWAAYAQDRFRTGPFTVEIGIRYSLHPPLTEAAGRMVNLNHNREALGVDWFAGRNGINRYAGAQYNRKAFAPRLGFAVPLRHGGTTVLRGSLSQMFDAGPYIYRSLLARNAPFAARQDLFEGSLVLGPSLAEGLPTPQAAVLPDAANMNRRRFAVYALEPSPYTPYSLQWDLRVQRRLPRQITAEVAGMASMGMHLYSMLNANQPYPAPTPYAWRRHPYHPFLGRVESLGFGGGSTFYGGQIRVSGAPSSGLQFAAAYRYAKAIDDAPPPMSNQSGRSAGAQYIYHPRSMRAASSFDVTQRLALSAYLELPACRSAQAARWECRLLSGWRTGASLLAQTGLPFTPELAINGLNNGGFWLPNRLGKGTLSAGERSIRRWFNTSLDRSDPTQAFDAPPLYQYGNSGYNILRGPGSFQLNAALWRTFRPKAPVSATLRVESYNLTNRSNFALPERLLGIPASGAISHTSGPSRRIEAELRLIW